MEKELIINGIKYKAVEEYTLNNKEYIGIEKTEKKVKPSLYDYTTIITYEDACEALGLEVDVLPIDTKIPKSEIACMKLKVIAKALRGGKEVNYTEQDWWYHPSFYLYPPNEVEKIPEWHKRQLNLIKVDVRSVFNDTNIYAFGCVNTTGFTFSHRINCVSRLYFLQPDEKIANYFGKQFIKLWAEYNDFAVIE